MGHICKVVWSPILHCRPMWIYYCWCKALLLYKYIGRKSLAPINGLTRLLALASCDCLHCKRRFCCELSRRIITNWWRHGRQFRQVWSEERMNFVTTHYSRVKPHSLVVADYWKSVGLVTGSNWIYYTMKRIVCRQTWPFDRSSQFLLSTSPQKYTYDRRRQDFSGRTARLATQDQPTVSHWRSL